MKIARKVPKVSVKSRHTATCKYKGKPKRLGCSCPKQLIWSKDGKEYRESAETCDGAAAETKALNKQAEFQRLATLTQEQIAAEIAQSERKTIAGVRDDFLAAKKAEGVSQKHIDSKIRVLLDALVQHCAEQNVIAIADVTLPLLENWRNSWTFSRETVRKKQQILKSFFEYALHREYVTKNPARGLGKIKGSDRKPTLPLDDAQFAQLLAAIPKLNGQTTDDTRTKLRGIMLLQRWTGLAIKDAVLFERKRKMDTKVDLFESINVWKRISGSELVLYRCFRNLLTSRYSVQSADFYRIPPNPEQMHFVDKHYLELLAENPPNERSSEFNTLQEAIEAHDRDFDQKDRHTLPNQH